MFTEGESEMQLSTKDLTDVTHVKLFPALFDHVLEREGTKYRKHKAKLLACRWRQFHILTIIDVSDYEWKKYSRPTLWIELDAAENR